MSYTEPESNPQPQMPAVSFMEAFWVWVRVAVYSFGGPAGQMAVMHQILVDEKKWVDEERFLHALNYTMLLPGPEAQQLATYIGWLLHGIRGGVVAGSLFVLPGFLSILALSVLYAGYQQIDLVQALFFGLKPAVLAVVLEAVFRIGSRALRNNIMYVVAGLAFVAIFFFDVAFPIIVLLAGLIGVLGGRFWPSAFMGQRSGIGPEMRSGIRSASRAAPPISRSVRILIIHLVLWFTPLLALFLLFGPEDIFLRIGLFFSKTAVVTFGGAYAVLAYIAQQAVEAYGWLQPGQMLDGLGMAETTPGPLIQVVQFVGFMAAFQNPGSLNPFVAGLLASLLTTWVTFVPCFLWIFLGAPYIESLRGNKDLSTALSAITAAVVGVVLNLAVWFSLQTLFATINSVYLGPVHLQIPDITTLDWAALFISAGAFLALFRFKFGMIRTLVGSALAGFIYYLVFLV